MQINWEIGPGFPGWIDAFAVLDIGLQLVRLRHSLSEDRSPLHVHWQWPFLQRKYSFHMNTGLNSAMIPVILREFHTSHPDQEIGILEVCLNARTQLARLLLQCLSRVSCK